MSPFKFRKMFASALPLPLALAAAAALAAGCADSSDESRHANKAEQAFLAAMAPHHESAIAMAAVASKAGGSP